VDVDIMPLNGSEIRMGWQETKFYTNVDIDTIPST
jgi:hypothetical protein